MRAHRAVRPKDRFELREGRCFVMEVFAFRIDILKSPNDLNIVDPRRFVNYAIPHFLSEMGVICRNGGSPLIYLTHMAEVPDLTNMP